MLQTLSSTDFPLPLGDSNTDVLFCLPEYYLAFQVTFLDIILVELSENI